MDLRPFPQHRVEHSRREVQLETVPRESGVLVGTVIHSLSGLSPTALPDGYAQPYVAEMAVSPTYNIRYIGR
jgi:hypothetical protein